MPHLGKVGRATEHVFLSLGLVSAFQSASHYGKQARKNAHPLISQTGKLALQQIFHCPSRADTPTVSPSIVGKVPLCFLCTPATSCPLPRWLVRGPCPKVGSGRRDSWLTICLSQSPHRPRFAVVSASRQPLGPLFLPHVAPHRPLVLPPRPLAPRADAELSAPAAGVSCGELWGESRQPRQVLWQFWASSGPDPSFLP